MAGSIAASDEGRSMQVVAGVLALYCLALGVLHVLRLALRRANPAGETSHAAMSVGMAAMFSPLGDPVPAPVWVALFGVCLAWFAGVAVRVRSVAGEPGHHVMGSAAMLFMVLAGHATHAGHGIGLTSIVAIVLAGYFAWHVLRCIDRLRVAVTQPPPGAPAPAAATAGGPVMVLPAIGTPRVAAVAHIAMAIGMTVMLLGMV